MTQFVWVSHSISTFLDAKICTKWGNKPPKYDANSINVGDKTLSLCMGVTQFQLFGRKNLSKLYTFCKIKCLTVVSIESCIISLPYSTSFRATDKRIIKYCEFVWAVTTYFTRSTFSWFYAHLIVYFLAIVRMLLHVAR